jgi:N-acetylneuraminic acid mutarotase
VIHRQTSPCGATSKETEVLGAGRAVIAMIAVIAMAISGCGESVPAASSSGRSSQVTEASQTPSPSTPQPTPSSAPATGTWTATGNLITARAEFTATLLLDGKVLVAGGIPDNTEQVELASAELYNPSTGTWSSTGSMSTPRSNHTATLLANGKVLVAGGVCSPQTTKGCPTVFDPDGAIAAAELYDPATGKWTGTGSMTTERYLHTATLLDDGDVLVTGAEHQDGILASAELYHSGTGKWTAIRSMITARTSQFAVKLGDGRVLIAGGVGPVSPTEHGRLASAEGYDPGTRKWAATGDLITARSQRGTAALLGDGNVLVAGGSGPGDPMLASAELYDPVNGTWSSTGSMHGPRGESASTLLADGRVFVVGGFAEPDVPDAPLLASAELFDPKTDSWIAAGSVGVGSFDLTATLLTNGQVLVTGGLVPDGVTSSAELYDPGPGN